MSTVQEFIINQSEKTIKYELSEFFTILHTKYYNTVDISFMDYFLELVDKEGQFCVEQERLKEYGVINSIDTSGKIKSRLDTLDLIEGINYNLANVSQVRKTKKGNNTGSVVKHIYSLTPEAFKLCLIRAKNSKVYAKYYLLLEKVLKHFQDYQYLYQQNTINRLENKIDEQNTKIDELLNYARDADEKLEDMNFNLEDVKDELNDTNELLNDIKGDNKVLSNKVDSIVKHANRRPNDTVKKSHDNFILIERNKEIIIYHGTKSYISNKLQKDDIQLLNLNYTPNPKNLVELLKTKITLINKDFKYNSIDKIRKDFSNKLISRNEKDLQINAIRYNSKLLTMKYNKFTFYYDFNTAKLIDLINLVDTERKEYYL